MTRATTFSRRCRGGALISPRLLAILIAVLLSVIASEGGGAAGPAGVAALYVSPIGSDRGQCTVQNPCATLDRAYHVAVPGQVVQVAGGTYSPQTITADGTKPSGTVNVVFRSAPGQLVVLGGLVVKHATDVEFQGNSAATPNALTGATSGITLMPTPQAVNSGADASVTLCSSHVVFRDIDIKLLTINNSSDVLVQGGAIGGHNNTSGNTLVTPEFHTVDQTLCPSANPQGIRFSHVLFHDVSRELFPTAHPDCLQIAGTEGLIIERSYFIRCATADILARPAYDIWAGAQLTGLQIANNFLGPLTESTGNIIALGSPSDKCGDILLAYNTSASGSLSAFQCSGYSSLRVIGNYQKSIETFTCKTALAKASLYDGNALGFAGGSSTDTCGAHSHLTGDPLFVDEATFDYRIERGSPLIGAGISLHPALDIDGKVRPTRLPADAGASQWESSLIALERSIGAVNLGMNAEQVRMIYGKPQRINRLRQKRSSNTYRLHGGDLSLTYSSAALVVGIEVTTPYYATITGVGVGAPMPNWAGLSWLPCRHAYVRRANGIFQVITPRGGRAGRVVGRIGMLRTSVPLC